MYCCFFHLLSAYSLSNRKRPENPVRNSVSSIECGICVTHVTCTRNYQKYRSYLLNAKHWASEILLFEKSKQNHKASSSSAHIVQLNDFISSFFFRNDDEGANQFSLIKHIWITFFVKRTNCMLVVFNLFTDQRFDGGCWERRSHASYTFTHMPSCQEY